VHHTEHRNERSDLNSVEIDLTPQQRESRDAIRGHIVFAICAILLILIAWLLLKELLIIYVSALFAAVLMPTVVRIMKFKIFGRSPSRAVAIVILIIGVCGLTSLFFFVGLPPVLHDLNQFSAELPTRAQQLIERLRALPFANRLGFETVASRAEGALTATASYLVVSLPNWITHLFDILTALFLCIYFMLEGEHAYRFFLSLFPSSPRRRLDTTLRRADQKIGKWLFGQGLLMLILGVSSTIVFYALHVRYALLLGFLMGLLNIIPIAGGVFTITLASIVAALDSWTKMLGVLLFYLVYINVENVYLTPRIMRSSVDLMGLTVLIALLLGTALAGITGALVAVPTAALIAVFLNEYAVHRDCERT
jgi:predicted PurR-regulated permease PerM